MLKSMITSTFDLAGHDVVKNLGMAGNVQPEEPMCPPPLLLTSNV